MKKKNNLSNILLILLLIVGLSLLLYPSFSDWWNSRVQSRAIASYTEQVTEIDDEEYLHMWDAAKTYNETLLDRSNHYLLDDNQKNWYQELLDVADTGVMGYVEIPLIEVQLPIYHGTDEAVLQIAVGHLDWTSLPVGGESTHCVLSGHRGLPSARLFTDLDQLQVGDLFYLWILDEKLTYEVDQILIVEPQVTENLLIEQGKDLCTLVTCTPYGVNSHRLLVRGHRIENEAEAITVRVTADALQIEPLLVAIILFVPILLLFLLISRMTAPKKRKNK